MNQSLEDGVDVAFFQPALPFDDAIMQSVQSLADPSGWQDISLPGIARLHPSRRPLTNVFILRIQLDDPVPTKSWFGFTIY